MSKLIFDNVVNKRVKTLWRQVFVNLLLLCQHVVDLCTPFYSDSIWLSCELRMSGCFHNRIDFIGVSGYVG